MGWEHVEPTLSGPALLQGLPLLGEGLQVRQAITYLLQTIDAGKLDKELADKVNALVNARAENMVRTGGKANAFENEDALFALCAEVSAAVEASAAVVAPVAGVVPVEGVAVIASH